MPVHNILMVARPVGAIYIGCPSKWGNPFVIGRDGDRDEVIAKHRRYLWNLIQTGRLSLLELAELNGRDLMCYCAPLACHGDTLLKAAAWAKQQLQQQPA